MKKVYFAGSIRGGRTDAELYKRMIAHLKRSCTVLTEHVGDLSLSKWEVCLDSPGSWKASGQSADDSSAREKAIYDQDTAWLRESDLVIAECTTPSLGVGYEMAYAERFGKPVHIFYDSTRVQLTAMLAGDPYFILHPYTREVEIYPVLDQILAD